MPSYYKFFTSIFFVPGYSRTTLVDVGRNSYTLVPNFYNSIYKKINNKNIEKANLYLKKNKKSIDFLLSKECLFICDSKTELLQFPEINLKFEYPGLISNVIIQDPDIILLKKSIKFLDEMNLAFYQLKFLQKVDLNDLDIMLSEFAHSSSRSIELILPDNSDDSKLIDLLKKHKRISYILLFNSNIEKVIKNPFFGIQAIIKTQKDASEIINGSIRDQSYFTSNITLYTESQKYHTYFNKKLYISKYGEIKNSYECNAIHGNIHNFQSLKDLKEIIISKKFQKYWLVKKDVCDVCKFCEFRHVCVDNRIPSGREDGTWYHEIECNYNPFIAKWKGQSGYRTLQESGITSSYKGFKINSQKLHFVNKEIWGNNP